MLSELLHRVSEHYEKNLPFVIYRKPKTTLVQAIFQKDNQVHYVNDFVETGFVFAPFDSNEQPILIPCDSIQISNYISTTNNKFEEQVVIPVDLSKKQFHINLVEKAIAQIKDGRFKKVVLSRKVKTKFNATPIDLFRNVLDAYGNAFCYLWYHPKIGLWLGATPEILLGIENQNFTTMSLAGTTKYVKDKKPNWRDKELDEQQLVTDYIFEALQDYVSDLKIGELESTRAGKLWHLRTKLTGRIEKESLRNIVQALHPTPAVCGLPSSIARDFILESENYNREFYTGFLGELNFKSEKERTTKSRNQENKAYRTVKKSTALFVNLRCMQLKESIAHIYIGGGVTHNSEAEKEWQETVAKSRTMLGVIR